MDSGWRNNPHQASASGSFLEPCWLPSQTFRRDIQPESGRTTAAALQEAFYVGILSLYVVLHGPGLLSVDALARIIHHGS